MIDTWKVLRFSFRFCCGVVTLIMVGYWIFKFKKNEDVSTIEYKDVNESSDLRLPEMTICLGRKTLSDADLNFEGYIDIRDYVQQVQKEKTREDFIKQQSNYKTTNSPIHFKWNHNFDGFWGAFYCRCYGLEIYTRLSSNANQIQIDFKPELSSLLQDFKSIEVFVLFNYPQQLLRNLGDIHIIWDNEERKTGLIRFKINAMEVITRRNRPNSPCFPGWKYFDNSVFERHRQDASCTTHHQVQNTTLCNTTKEILNSSYSISKLKNKYFHPPCHEMTGIVSTMNTINVGNVTSPALMIDYPEKIKVITQLKSVDAHMLIGNIGGYVGLFLGNILFKQY